jgi:arginyl-tRNA--protein-N-Asp/Glu arginylyltransferase
MKIIYDHTHGFGKMRDQSYIYAPVGALVEEKEYNEALETGWCPLTKNLWFQTRSTRISIKDYLPKKDLINKSKKVRSFFGISLDDQRKKIFQEIFDKYINHKKFKSQDYSLQDIINTSNGHVYYAERNKVIGFCFFKLLENNIFAVEFAWDYENPKLSLGKLNIHFLCNYAKMKKYNNVYMSSGYESCSIYKSDYQGFEWWTGLKWSKDVEHYRRLCYSDDKVKIEFNWENL